LFSHISDCRSYNGAHFSDKTFYDDFVSAIPKRDELQDLSKVKNFFVYYIGLSHNFPDKFLSLEFLTFYLCSKDFPHTL